LLPATALPYWLFSLALHAYLVPTLLRMNPRSTGHAAQVDWRAFGQHFGRSYESVSYKYSYIKNTGRTGGQARSAVPWIAWLGWLRWRLPACLGAVVTAFVAA
jgi:hypothetical protein